MKKSFLPLLSVTDKLSVALCEGFYRRLYKVNKKEFMKTKTTKIIKCISLSQYEPHNDTAVQNNKCRGLSTSQIEKKVLFRTETDFIQRNTI